MRPWCWSLWPRFCCHVRNHEPTLGNCSLTHEAAASSCANPVVSLMVSPAAIVAKGGWFSWDILLLAGSVSANPHFTNRAWERTHFAALGRTKASEELTVYGCKESKSLLAQVAESKGSFLQTQRCCFETKREGKRKRFVSARESHGWTENQPQTVNRMQPGRLIQSNQIFLPGM